MFRASSCPSSGATTTAVASSGLPLERGGSSAVCRCCVGRSARPRQTTLLPPRSSDKPEAATAVVKLLMMGIRMPETCWAVFKRQVINLRNCCIWLVDSFECMMMHGFANQKKEEVGYWMTCYICVCVCVCVCVRARARVPCFVWRPFAVETALADNGRLRFETACNPALYEINYANLVKYEGWS
jgi:hypothetical protein